MTPNRESVRVREEVARAIREYPTGRYDHAAFPLLPSEVGRAAAVLNRLRELNLITSEGLELIKAEEKAE